MFLKMRDLLKKIRMVAGVTCLLACCNMALASVVPYACDSFVDGVTSKATGFFRVERLADGKWWVIDPLGRGMMIFGVDHIGYVGHTSTLVNPPRRRYYDHNKKAYASRQAWETATINRLKSWGFNMLGAGCDSQLERRGLAHTRYLTMGQGFAQKESDHYICQYLHAPGTAFPNVFSPDFPAWCESVAKKNCSGNSDDPWLFGYFLDNELCWWGHGSTQTGLWDAVLSLPAEHTAHIALKKYAQEKGVDPSRATAEAKAGFIRLIAHKYFEATTRAIRKYDSNHMILGPRFATEQGAPDVAWEVSGEYCDLLTFNSYPNVDLDTGVITSPMRFPEPPITESYAQRHELAKVPILITEWSFIGLDSGLPCMHGAGQRFRTQKERARAAELYVRTVLTLPYLVGYDFFMWVDEPPMGFNQWFGEDSNYGLVNEEDEPYPELVGMFERLQNDVMNLRKDESPAVRIRAQKTQTGWKGRALQEWKVNGVDVGSFSMMLSAVVEGKRTWVGCKEVVDCQQTRFPGGCVWHQTARGSEGEGVSFEMTYDIRFLKGKNILQVNVQAIRNTGRCALNDITVYFMAEAPYAIELGEDRNTVMNSWTKRKRLTPSLWKGPRGDYWIAADGRYIGMVTCSKAKCFLTYWVDKKNNSQHPDFALAPTDSPLRLDPNEVHVSDGRLWAYVVGGTDGEDGWLKTVSQLEKLHCPQNERTNK